MRRRAAAAWTLVDEARWLAGMLAYPEARRAAIIAEARALIARDPQLRPNATSRVRTARELIRLGQELEAALGGFEESGASAADAWTSRGARA